MKEATPPNSNRRFPFSQKHYLTGMKLNQVFSELDYISRNNPMNPAVAETHFVVNGPPETLPADLLAVVALPD